MTTSDTRIEIDALGAISVARRRMQGGLTQRALQHFKNGEERLPRAFIRALGIVKRSGALANIDLDNLDESIGRAIAEAAQEVIDGKLDDHFPLVVWQTGFGTQPDMNANEVIANRVNERLGAGFGSKAPIHPNDHCNRSQSTNGGNRAGYDRITELLEKSLMLVTALVPHIGYDNAAHIAGMALKNRSTFREAAIASGLVTAELFDAVVRPEQMISPK